MLMNNFMGTFVVVCCLRRNRWRRHCFHIYLPRERMMLIMRVEVFSTNLLIMESSNGTVQSFVMWHDVALSLFFLCRIDLIDCWGGLPIQKDHQFFLSKVVPTVFVPGTS